MTNEPNELTPVEGSERPGQALAMEMAQYFKLEFQRLEKSVTEQVRTALQTNATTVKRMQKLEDAFLALNRDLEQRAQDRADKDVREAEARYILAQEQRDRLTTQEKIDVTRLMDDREAAARKARADRWHAFWDRITPNIATAMILAIVIPVWLAVVIAILAFVLRALGIQVPVPT